jgi:hypothetical protein
MKVWTWNERSHMASHSCKAVQWYYNDANTVDMKIKVYWDMMLCTLVQKVEEDLDFLKPAGGHSNLPQNVSNYTSNHMVSHPRSLYLHEPLWKPQIPHY